MAVGATIVTTSAALLLQGGNFHHAIADCAFAVIIATGTAVTVNFRP